MARKNNSRLNVKRRQAEEDTDLIKLIAKGRKSGRAEKGKLFKRFDVKQSV